MSIYCWQRVI